MVSVDFGENALKFFYFRKRSEKSQFSAIFGCFIWDIKLTCLTSIRFLSKSEGKSKNFKVLIQKSTLTKVFLCSQETPKHSYLTFQ